MVGSVSGGSLGYFLSTARNLAMPKYEGKKWSMDDLSQWGKGLPPVGERDVRSNKQVGVESVSAAFEASKPREI